MSVRPPPPRLLQTSRSGKLNCPGILRSIGGLGQNIPQGRHASNRIRAISGIDSPRLYAIGRAQSNGATLPIGMETCPYARYRYFGQVKLDPDGSRREGSYPWHTPARVPRLRPREVTGDVGRRGVFRKSGLPSAKDGSEVPALSSPRMAVAFRANSDVVGGGRGSHPARFRDTRNQREFSPGASEARRTRRWKSISGQGSRARLISSSVVEKSLATARTNTSLVIDIGRWPAPKKS